LYKEHENVTNRELDAIKEWLKENECIIRGQEVPRPIFEFIESGFPGLFLFKVSLKNIF